MLVIAYILCTTLLAWGTPGYAAFYRPEDYVMRRTPQYMHHHGIADNWAWSPGYVGETRFCHVPPQIIRKTLYPEGYSRWGDGLDAIPVLKAEDLDALARKNHWKSIRKLLTQAATETPKDSVDKKTYLRLMAHLEGVGGAFWRKATQ